MNLTAKSDEQQTRTDSVQRLQVYLAHGGVSSRRGAEKIIAQGRVTVNGRKILDMGVKVNPGDEVLLDGKPVRPETRFHYLVLNKPEGYICASSDTHGRPLALDLLPQVPERLYNVGRLDFQSCGLVIFTNDGDFSAKVSHPGSQIEKEYLVTSTVPVPDQVIEDFTRGVLVEGVMYKALKAEKTGSRTIRVVMVEGKNREIRRVFSYFHLHPQKLMRIRIGPIKLENLGEGESRKLGNWEIRDILSSIKKVSRSNTW